MMDKKVLKVLTTEDFRLELEDKRRLLNLNVDEVMCGGDLNG